MKFKVYFQYCNQIWKDHKKRGKKNEEIDQKFAFY